MSLTTRSTIVLTLALLGLAPLVYADKMAAIDTDDLTAEASWQILTPAEIQQQLVAWLVERETATETRELANELWGTSETDDRLDVAQRVAATIALVEPRALPLIAASQHGATPIVAADAQWLDDESLPPLIKNNLRLLLGRSLAQGMYFDEALQQLEGLTINDVFDRPTLLFFQGVAHHRLIHKNRGLEALDRLLENKNDIPRRYSVLAQLMRSDLAQIKDGSLDDISRRMNDIRRRLELGRANKRVTDVEREVIEMLDKLIKDEEDKQAQAQSSGSGGGQSARPMPDSRPVEQKGPGKVTKREIGRSAGWGELPPRQREQAMQEIGRDYPAHYREVIEEYFREVAKLKR